MISQNIEDYFDILRQVSDAQQLTPAEMLELKNWTEKLIQPTPKTEKKFVRATVKLPPREAKS